MLRADRHPDFCLYHAARQEEIFALLPEREFALAPELEALAADLTTATGVNRALGQVFRLLAQNRITRKDAVAFGYIAQLLLQTVPGVRAEAVSAFGHEAWASHLQSTLTPQPDPPAAESTAPVCAPPAPAASPSTPPRAAKPENPVPVAAVANASATSAFSRPNYADLLSRSLDLFDGKFDVSPESQRESRRLLRDLEQITPPRVTDAECVLPQTRSQPAQNVHLQNEHPDRMFVPSDEPEPRRALRAPDAFAEDLSSRYRA
jgi:hypothetical protein